MPHVPLLREAEAHKEVSQIYADFKRRMVFADVEIIGMSALAVYANIMADATAMENDEMFDRL